MADKSKAYPASLDIEYPRQERNRLTVFFRIICSIPILIVLGVLTGADSGNRTDESGLNFSLSSNSIIAGLFMATLLLIVFRQRYPRWWFDFALELRRFSTRVGAYFLLLTDLYPSTVDRQTVQLDLVYPDAKAGLNRWLPLVKWLLALPHYIVLVFLGVGTLVATLLAWFAILFTGRHPQGLFDFVVGVNRWALRVEAYALLLITDQYPPFSLK